MEHKNTLFKFKRSPHARLPPGTLIHTGERKIDQVQISTRIYDKDTLAPFTSTDALNPIPETNPAKTTWINIDGLHKLELIKQIGEHFQIHPLILEDIVNTEQRPKFEDLGDYLFIVLKMLYWNPHKNILETEQVSILIMPHVLISFQERPGDVFDGIRERLQGKKGRIRKSGTDYLAYALMDAVVDNYFNILEKLGDEIESLEDEVMTAPSPNSLQTLHTIKRRLLYMKKAIWPLREAVSQLERAESTLVHPPSRPYFRDIYDHAVQIIDMLETMRDMNAGLFDMYMSSVSNRMNEVMKVLTIIATIFIPITFIAGIYGMNFEWMPELKWKYAYFAVWGLILLVTGGMLAFFKRKKWL